ncbi:heterokaryon incompatibility protein-domain-containing protein [Collybia nuda]|uniref:Heterokaryon incompatibility protein-domain-containing protein n=1 Tax=Collybia nuda TaxID=64659 RepID=A0A9P6CJF6_9AGAR|nr:heterokaryon incompatibility protein-domain-containing protein [Collybia nuda]
MSSEASSVYAALPLNSFRLLTVLPESPQDPGLLVCRLSTHYIASAPSYTALSYTWGSNRNPVSIQIEGHSFPIGQNLHQALTHIRLNAAGDPVVLWVDAICINQVNLDERMDQVRQMNLIYRSASDVLVWLGLPSSDSSVALDFVLELPSLLEGAKRAGSEQSRYVLNDSSIQPRWLALAYLLLRPWWRRVWIIQEISLARAARLFVGTRSIPWSAMHATLSELRHSWQWAMHADTEHTTAKVIEIASTGRSLFDIVPSLVEHGHTADLGALLKITHIFKSTDPRDKIYALLGLTDTHTQAHIQPDYRKSLPDVYRDTFTYLYTRHHGQGLGDMSWITGGVIVHENQREVPSWTPDFRWCNANESLSWASNNPNPWFYVTDTNGSGGIGHGSSAPLQLYHTGDPVIAGLKPVSPRFSENTMTVLGVQFDTIESMEMFWLHDLVEYTEKRITETDLVSKLKSEAESGETIDVPYIAGGSSRMAFYRTLLLDCAVPYINPQTNIPLRLPKEMSSGFEVPGNETLLIPPRTAADVDTLLHRIQRSLSLFHGRCIARTSTGYVGIVPRTAKSGDWVCVLLGGEMPYVLSGVEGDHFRLIGECYIHGIMDGEVMEDVRSGKHVLRDIVMR